LLIEKKNEYHCETFEPSSPELPSKLDFKMFMEQSEHQVSLRTACREKLDICMGDVLDYLAKV
jgi:hypothetical protein